MNIDSLFNDFLAGIRLTKDQRDDLITGHTTLRKRLLADKDLAPIIVATFLQGSYRRATAVRPKNGKRADVDVIVVTNLDRSKVTPSEALEKFKQFMDDHYEGKYEFQDRSIGIELSYVDLDVVITSAPSEVAEEMLSSRSIQSQLSLEDFPSTYPWKMVKGWDDTSIVNKSNYVLNEYYRKASEWKSEALWIPDRNLSKWEQTDPLEQIRWTREKNANTDGHYVNVVKAVKWMRLEKLLPDIKYPKGYPLEHMIGDMCPDGVESVGEGVMKSLENFNNTYAAYRTAKVVPSFADRGVPSHNVWHRISVEDFCAFYDKVADFGKTARKAYEAPTIEEQATLWQDLFGSKFPDPPKKTQKASAAPAVLGFTQRNEQTSLDEGRFA